MMRYRALGKTGLQVPEVSLGAWKLAADAKSVVCEATERTEAGRTLFQRAYALGCNFFDVSDCQGHGEREICLGRVLPNLRRMQAAEGLNDVVIATSGGQEFGLDGAVAKPNFSARHLQRSVEESLKRLNVEALDLYQLQTPPLALIQNGQVFEVLQALKQQGKIRFYGVSIHDPQEGVQAIQHGAVDVVQVAFNLFDQRMLHQLVSVCQRTQTGLIVREPLARGFLAGAYPENHQFPSGDRRSVWPRPLIHKRVQAAQRFQSLLPQAGRTLAQLALAYPLAWEAVSTVLVGCRTLSQWEENAVAGSTPLLSAEMLEAIRVIQGSL